MTFSMSKPGGHKFGDLLNLENSKFFENFETCEVFAIDHICQTTTEEDQLSNIRKNKEVSHIER